MHANTHSKSMSASAFTPVFRLFLLSGACALLVPAAHAASPRVVLTPAPGFSITWDGNNGGFSSPEAGAGPSNNVALASRGTTAFTSSDLGPVLSIPFHRAENLNDGLYGNSHSWISANGVGGTSDPDPFAGLRFAASVNVSSIAWGRDNGDGPERGDGAPFTDRTLGTYTLQYTTVASPDGATPDTGDASTGWANVGTIQYLTGTDDANFASYLRHRFDVAEAGNPIAATGLRIKVSDGNTDLDEIEVNPIADPVPPISNFIEIIPAAGFGLSWDRNDGDYSTPNNPAPAPVNDASLARGAVPFTSTDAGPALSVPFHRAVNLNDGLYGNANSWIPNFVNGDAMPFGGIRFARRTLVRNIAWGRDNGNVAGDCCGGTLTDRSLGLYVIQVTTASNPGANTPDACGPNPNSGWVTVGTVKYKSANPGVFTPHLRHRFDLSQNGAPIPATAIRIRVPDSSSDIDEIEVNANVALENQLVRITNAPGLALTWDGNDGQFNNSAVGAAPPANRALASAGTTPFTSSDLGPVLSIPFHRAVNLNDGLYGNANSWISANGVGGTSDPDPFAGLSFGGTVLVTNIAWGRDNGNVAGDCCGGTLTDRSLDTYRLQYTAAPTPDATTPDTGDAATGWEDVATVTYAGAAPSFFTPSLRHRFDVAAGGAPLQATGLRIKVGSGNTDIDEIEVNTATTAPAAPGPVGITAAAGFGISWDGNDGHYNNPAVVAEPPPNRALATAGTSPFTSSDLGPALSVPFHRAINLNDGRYGNANSWIPDFVTGDPAPFAGLNFNGVVAITNIAWSRDNGNVAADCCGGTATDRVLGVYTVQVTSVPTPDAATAETGDTSTGWETVGTITYLRSEAPDFNPHLRHRFELSSAGGPITATGLRIKVPDANSDLDEIEVNTAAIAPAPRLTIARSATSAILSWIGGGGLESASNIAGPWTCLGEAAPGGYTVSLSTAATRFYRVRR